MTDAKAPERIWAVNFVEVQHDLDAAGKYWNNHVNCGKEYIRKDLYDALAKERDELAADIVRDRARLLAEVERLRDLVRRAKVWFDPYSPDRGQWLHDYKTCMQGKEGKSDG